MKSSGMGGFPMRKSTMPRKMDSPALKSGLNRSSLGGGFRRPILRELFHKIRSYRSSSEIFILGFAF